MITLNAFPISLTNEATITACKFAYGDDYEKIKIENADLVFTRHKGKSVLCFSADGKFPINGDLFNINLDEDMQTLSILIKDSIVRLIKEQNRNIPYGFNPIQIISSQEKDNLLNGIVPTDFPFSINTKYDINTRIIQKKLHLIIDCSTRTTTTQAIKWFIDNQFPVLNKYIVIPQQDGYRKLAGKIIRINNDTVTIINREGQEETKATTSIFLDSSRENLDAFINFSTGKNAKGIVEKIRQQVGYFNGGKTKQDRINKFKNYLKDKIQLINGLKVTIGDNMNVEKHCYTLNKPAFIFNDNYEETWQEKGLTNYGPYTKRTFDKNDPHICVICLETVKGQIEQFVRKFLKGVPDSKYFSNGMEGKFHIGTCKTEFFTIKDDSIDSYKTAIQNAIEKKTQDGNIWNFALIQVKQEFKNLSVEHNPYFIARRIFLTHQIPIQDFTLELLSQTDSQLGYSLSNMALASYAKMGGVPWLLKSSPAISHELVIGIGSTILSSDRLGENSRIMGITTVFSGDGSYIISNTSKAVSPEKYASALTNVLDKTLEKVKSRMNWQTGDTLRIVFHASVKKFNNDEITAIKEIINKYSEFNIEYAFLKISENHGIHMFDSASSNLKKGQYAPSRGKVLKISDFENLVYLIGHNELKQASDGHPRGLLLTIHKDSTFKDIKYLTTQVFNFSAHSWRSYFVNPIPVTITYSDLIAKHLGWLGKLQGWDDSVMISKIGQTQWFL